jgi:hypothetical protein
VLSVKHEEDFFFFFLNFNLNEFQYIVKSLCNICIRMNFNYVRIEIIPFLNKSYDFLCNYSLN